MIDTVREQVRTWGDCIYPTDSEKKFIQEAIIYMNRNAEKQTWIFKCLFRNFSWDIINFFSFLP